MTDLVKELKWDELTEYQLSQNMYLNLVIAKEFTISLKAALVLYPDDVSLGEMAKEELQADNLSYEDFIQKADHWEFLEFFIKKYNLKLDARIMQVASEYYATFDKLEDEVRAMTVFKQEKDSVNLFQELLKSPGWNPDNPLLNAYQFFLKKHIELDSGDGGHAALVSNIPTDNRVEVIYSLYDKMASVLFSL